MVKKLWQCIEKYFQVKLSSENILFGINLGEEYDLHKYISIAILCISKFKNWTYPNLLYLFECECRLRNIKLWILYNF